MASIRKRGKQGKYFARIQWRDSKGDWNEESIDLLTTKKSTALVRKTEIEKLEDTIKNGDNWSLAWQNEEGQNIFLRLLVT